MCSIPGRTFERSSFDRFGAQALAKRHVRSADFGRPSIAPDRLLRCVILNTSEDGPSAVGKELRASLLYRRFTRFYEDPIPDFFSFSAPLGSSARTEPRNFMPSRSDRARAIRRLRTKVAHRYHGGGTNIHHPTDSSLLADGIRVLTRGLHD